MDYEKSQNAGMVANSENAEGNRTPSIDAHSQVSDDVRGSFLNRDGKRKSRNSSPNGAHEHASKPSGSSGTMAENTQKLPDMVSLAQLILQTSQSFDNPMK
jgi:hypothetical protein